MPHVQAQKTESSEDLYRVLIVRTGHRANEPKSNGALGRPPKHFSDEHAAAWREIAANCCDGVLIKADRIAVEIACYLLVEFRKAPTEFQAARMKQLISLLGKFGMTPSDRTKLSIQPTQQPAVDPWDAI